MVRRNINTAPIQRYYKCAIFRPSRKQSTAIALLSK
jgi:hypothetical protein